MKSIILLFIFSFSLLSLTAQDNYRDSTQVEINSLELMKQQLLARGDSLREVTHKIFVMKEKLNQRMDSIEVLLRANEKHKVTLERKKTLTKEESRELETLKKCQSEKKRIAKFLAELEKKFEGNLAILDEMLGLQIELDEKIKQLKLQSGTK